LSNNIQIKNISEEEISKFFINDPQLVYLGLPDADLVSLFQEKKWYKSKLTNCVGVFDNNTLIFVFKYEFFTPVCLNGHFFMSSKYRHTGKFEEIVALLKDFVKTSYPQITKCIVMTPALCTHVPPTCQKFGFIQEGHIKECITWREQLTDLLIFGLKL
jgi:hypothetical protein